MTSPPALSSKLERVPNNYSIADQGVSITLSTQSGGEGRGEGGGFCVFVVRP